MPKITDIAAYPPVTEVKEGDKLLGVQEGKVRQFPANLVGGGGGVLVGEGEGRVLFNDPLGKQYIAVTDLQLGKVYAVYLDTTVFSYEARGGQQVVFYKRGSAVIEYLTVAYFDYNNDEYKLVRVQFDSEHNRIACVPYLLRIYKVIEYDEV